MKRSPSASTSRRPDPLRVALARASLAAMVIASASCSKSESGDPGTPPDSGAKPPAFYLEGQFTSTLRATKAVVDAGTIWLVDDNGDLVFGADPAAHWDATKGLSLSWAQLPGAAKYHVVARNKNTAPTDWKELAVLPAPDPALSPVVVATGLNPWSAGLGSGGYPWSFGNGVEFAVSAEDAQGATGALTGILETSDGFPGLITGIAIDDPTLPAPFAPTLERGATFDRTFRLSFSEPMRTDSPPTLRAQASRLTVNKVLETKWGSTATEPSTTPTSAGAHAFLVVELGSQGSCTELLVPRTTGDTILQVRDASLFGAGSGSRILFVGTQNTPSPLGEASPISSVDPSAGLLVLASPLAFDAPSGSLLCAITDGPRAPTHVTGQDGARIVVGQSAPFYVGETVGLYEPAAAGAAGVLDVRTVTGLDTGTNAVVLDAAPSAGHTAASVLLQLDGAIGETPLRSSVELVLIRDVAGGPSTELFLAAPSSVMVGDTVVVDADGHLETTPDQAQARVAAVHFAPTGAPSYSIVVDLPPSMLLLHGQARVLATGDAFLVSGTRDTSASAPTPLDRHADQFTADGLRF